MDKAVAAREILLLGAFEEARGAAALSGIEVVALKGTALLELGYYQPGERGMTDADVLVPPAGLKAFEAVLGGLGYAPMPDSSDAWVRPSGGGGPPAIIDVHTGLWHIKNTGELFRWGLEPGPGGLFMNQADLFLHCAAHPLLHHGELGPRALEDCARVALRAPGDGDRFWQLVARKTEVYGLRPAIWPVISRLSFLTAARLDLFRPRGLEKIKAAFFEKAALKHSAPLEYLLPALHRPELFLKYLFPDRRFMERRYKTSSAAAYALRPLRLLRSLFR